MNCSECCQAIGCNCGGTCSAEFLGNIPIWVWPVIFIGVLLILLFITYQIKGINHGE
jgi:hypothetical protein